MEIKRLLSVSNADARAWYLKEAAEQMWSYRTLVTLATQITNKYLWNLEGRMQK